MANREESCCQPMFWVSLLVSAILVMFAGLMSGLTLGLMSLSLVDLEVLSQAGKPEDRVNAAKILPVVKNQHLLLCTLLIGNSLAMEALPIFLDSLVPSWGAILISVTLILAFGEACTRNDIPLSAATHQFKACRKLGCSAQYSDDSCLTLKNCGEEQIIPQAVCTRYGLKVGAKLAGVVRILLVVFFPVAYPISKLLDRLLGKGHVALMRRAELKTLVDMHGNEAGKGGELTHDETTIITGALDLTQKTAKDAMRPISETFSLDINSKLDMHTMGLLMTKGHSRVPVYSKTPSNIIGIILVKSLITCRPEDEIPVRNLTIRKILTVPDYLPLYEILNEFQKGHSHMAAVAEHMKDFKGFSNRQKGSVSVSGNRMHLNRKRMEAGEKGEASPMCSEEQGNVVGSFPSVIRGVNGTHCPTLSSMTEQRREMHKQPKKWDRGSSDCVLDVDVESLPSYLHDQEVIGIITMEDVIEELLQEEILDETDEYVDIHNKIRINMLSPSQVPVPPSPGKPSVGSPAEITVSGGNSPTSN